MNCTEAGEALAAHAEGLLDPTTAAALERHLAACADCRASQASLSALHRQLAARAAVAANVSLAAGVMSRIRRDTTRNGGRIALFTPLVRWALGGTCAVAAIAALSLVALPPDTRAQAADVLTRGIQAASSLATVHLQGRMRTAPRDNFSHIDPKADFRAIEMWKELAGAQRWRIEKPGRVAVMDGQATMLWVPEAKLAIKAGIASASAFDTGWLHSVADIERTLTEALRLARQKDWKVELTSATDADGVVQKLVTIEAPPNTRPGDRRHGHFLSTTTTRRLFGFDDATGRLRTMRIYAAQDNAADFVLVFELTGIDYNQPIPAGRFEVELPAGVAWSDPAAAEERPAVIPTTNTAGQSAEHVARRFFEACSREDWTTVAGLIGGTVPDRLKAALGGLTLVRLDAASASDDGLTRVPYEIAIRDGRSIKQKLILRPLTDVAGWQVKGGL